MLTVKEISDPNHIKLMVDEKRQEVLRVLRNQDEPMTVKQIADELGVKPANVHFHVKKLEEIDILHMVRTEEVHGIIAKYYEPTAMIFKLTCKELDPGTQMQVNMNFASAAEISFEKEKQKFIEISQRGQSGGKRLSNSDIYLTREEFTELNDLIDGIIDKYRYQTNEKQAIHHMFFSCITDLSE